MSERPHPVTPAVYRPALSASSQSRNVVVPTVYRPATARSTQRKLAAPAVYVPARQPSNVAALQRAAVGRAIQPKRMTQFDTSGWSTGLTGGYDEIHFTYLDDSEIDGSQATNPAAAHPGENLHVTFRSNTGGSQVAHYFYHRASQIWRYHSYGGATVPYGTHTHATLASLKQRAIDFAYPSAVFFKTAKPKKKKAVAPVTTSAPVARPSAPSLNQPWKWDEDYGMQTSRERDLEELRKAGSRLPMWLGQR
jgi:hypothetical protein